jgi:hypothetical protein
MNRKVNNITVEDIEKLLIFGFLDSGDARKRSPLIKEDFDWIDFDSLMFDARPCQFIEEQTGSSFCIPEYHFGETRHSIDSAEHAEVIKVEWMGGTGLDCGHLLFFSRVSEIARRTIPHYWLKPCKLRDLLRDPIQHLDTTEEIWWLDRWKSPENIKSSVKLKHDSATDVDWTFTVGDDALTINLEVKRMIGDCVRHVTERRFKIDWFEQFCDKKVNPKFRASKDSEVNVLGLSLFGEITREVQLVISEWLTNRQDLIDAVLVVTREARRKSCFDVQLRNGKARLMKSFLNEPSLEDQSLAYSLTVPVKIPGIPSIVKP